MIFFLTAFRAKKNYIRNLINDPENTVLLSKLSGEDPQVNPRLNELPGTINESAPDNPAEGNPSADNIASREEEVKGLELRRACIEKIRQRYSREEFRQVAEGYIKCYRGALDTESADLERMNEAAMDLAEEILADAYADLNAFGLGAWRYGETVQETVEERRAMGGREPFGERTTRGPPEGKFSIEEDENGQRYVDINVDQDLFDGLSPDEQRNMAMLVIKSRFSQKVIGTVNRAYVNNHTAREYAYPAKKIKSAEQREAKYRASTELDHLLDAGTNFRTQEDGAYGHTHSKVTGGYSYFDVLFRVNGKMYQGTINLENTKNGLRFKDVTQIKETTGAKLFATGETQPANFPGGQGDDDNTRTASTGSIRGNGEKVNRYSLEDENLKQRQFQTIQESHPAEDDYHTWIRSEEEIRTFGEAVSDPEWADYGDFAPDYTREMAETAQRTGSITVYSAYPIKAGVFVTPSRMEAESYAGDGHVYSRKVKLEDVAWIDPIEGQFAKRTKSGNSYSLEDVQIPTREELERKDPVRVVDIRENAQGSYREQRKSFLESEEAQALYREPIHNRDTDTLMFVTPATIKHIYYNQGQENISMAKHLREIGEEAVLTHREVSRNAPDDHTTGVYTFFAAVRTEQGISPTKLTVKEFNIAEQDVPKEIIDYIQENPQDTYARVYDGKVLILGELDEIEKDASSSISSKKELSPISDANQETSSKISIKDLLALVKGENEKYLPEREDIRHSLEDADYTIERNEDGHVTVRINSDILENKSRAEWKKVVEETLKKIFSGGISVARGEVILNKRGRGEFTNGSYSRMLERTDPELHEAKMKMAPGTGAMVKNAENVSFESPKHERTDDIVGFNKGNIRAIVSGKGYTGDVITAVYSDGKEVFFDVNNLAREENETLPMRYAAGTSGFSQTDRVSNKAVASLEGVPSKTSIDNNGEKVNWYSLEDGEEAEERREKLERLMHEYERETEAELPPAPESWRGEDMAEPPAPAPEPETETDGRLHLPPPPGTDEESARETRQRELERAARRMEKKEGRRRSGAGRLLDRLSGEDPQVDPRLSELPGIVNESAPDNPAEGNPSTGNIAEGGEECQRNKRNPAFERKSGGQFCQPIRDCVRRGTSTRHCWTRTKPYFQRLHPG